MQKGIDRAKVLVEALPYIRQFRGRTVVIKVGGAAMDDSALRDQLARDLILLQYVGILPVVVHGGGPQIGQILSRMNMSSRFVGGMRVTDDETMNVVEMVLGGSVNKEIVRVIHHAGGQAVGLTGKDGRLVLARKIPYLEQREKGQDEPVRVDPGRVGEVESVDPTILKTLLGAGFIPVIAPVGVDETGRTLNINADPFAAQIAIALRAEKLLLLTDTEGVRDERGELRSSLSAAEAQRLIEQGVIDGGMIPKVTCGLGALREGVRKVHIIDGRREHSILLELFTDQGIGTELGK